jgi:hypothetical protein
MKGEDMTTTVAHPGFRTVARLIDYIDRHWRNSPHTVTTYSNYVDAYFIAHGELPDGFDVLKYYNYHCCVPLRDFDRAEMAKLIELARKNIAEGEIRDDWRDKLVGVMQPHRKQVSLR